MSRTMKPLQDRETKIVSSKMYADIESAHDDIAKLWKSVGDIERRFNKQKLNPHDDPSHVGELARAINSQMKKKVIDIGPAKSVTTDDTFYDEVDRRLDQLERETNRLAEKNNSTKLWKTIESIESDQSKLFSKFSSIDLYDKKFRKLDDAIQSTLADVELKSNVSQSSRKSDKRLKLERKLREDVEFIKTQLVKHEDHLNNCDDAIQDMDNFKGKFKTLALKADLKRLASDMQELKTKVMEPLTTKCSKLIMEMAKKEDMKVVKKGFPLFFKAAFTQRAIKTHNGPIKL